MDNHTSSTKRRPVFIFIGIGIFLVVIYLLFKLLDGLQLFANTAYSAIFLTNGQVYFGHIKHIDKNIISLANVYYLQASSNLTGTDKNKKQEEDLQVALIKLGKEIHGPKDMMMINRQSVLFWEELRDDGKVVQAIKHYK